MLGDLVKLTVTKVLIGPFGSASHCVFAEPPDMKDWQATVSSWFLDCPGQSPAWSKYTLGIIHLRDIDGVPPAVISVPHATHEVMLFALEPEANPNSVDTKTWQRLIPHNVNEQIELPDDAAAILLLEECAKAVVNGILPAEPALAGAREPWRTVLVQTAAHARGELVQTAAHARGEHVP